ncbi:hypothetical protein Q73_04235 [Bacillus coahuilensis m2-6]|uniref:YjcG family protein n=1 Tax=Bacillus coahuilensis TaxID=408580 RepID=UPI0007503B87|nr:YjcG family protein [Bacillus coahuilensis]KUP08937.1 hypothetical protein Q73_04235 [Bacillus coahuilensis m2-6]
MKYGIVIFPSKQIQDFANSYRKRYDPNYALITPHVTLKPSFEASEDELKGLTEHLQVVSQNTSPFSLHAYKFSSFSPVNNVIYLKLEATEKLVRLYQDLNQDHIIGGVPEYPFVPHITVGQGLSNDEHSDVFGSLQMQQVEFNETVDRFHLLYQLENGSWTVYETYRLGKDC